MKTLYRDMAQGESIKIDAPAQITVIAKTGKKTRIRIETEGSVVFLNSAQKCHHSKGAAQDG